jgi:hypothetical protein
MQLIEFLAVRQLFREHDLADLLFNGNGSILSELRLSRFANSHPHLGVPAQIARLLPPNVGNVIDPVRTARAILPAGSLAVAKTPSWFAGLQAGRIRLEARIPADQYKRPRGRPLTQVRAQNWTPSDLVAFGVADSSVSLLLCARDVFLATFCYFVWYRSEPHDLNHE